MTCFYKNLLLLIRIFSKNFELKILIPPIYIIKSTLVKIKNKQYITVDRTVCAVIYCLYKEGVI